MALAYAVYLAVPESGAMRLSFQRGAATEAWRERGWGCAEQHACMFFCKPGRTGKQIVIPMDTLAEAHHSGHAPMTLATSNRQLVLDAFDTLFNRRDYSAAKRLWSPTYQQHSAHIPPGRDGLFDLIRAAPAALRYEAGRALAEHDIVMVHGRYSNTGLPADWIVVDIVRVVNGQLVEHWDVIQDEATRATSKSGLPMFGLRFPEER